VKPIWKGKMPDAIKPITPSDVWNKPKKPLPKPEDCHFEGPKPGFLAGCASDKCKIIPTLESAKKKCLYDELCTGVTKLAASSYNCRASVVPMSSPSGEESFVKICIDPNEDNNKGGYEPVISEDKAIIVHHEEGKMSVELGKKGEWSEPEFKLYGGFKNSAGKSCGFSKPQTGFIGGCTGPEGKSCVDKETWKEAAETCVHTDNCGGIILNPSGAGASYQLRSGTRVTSSPAGEVSWIKSCPSTMTDVFSTDDRKLNKIGKIVNGHPTIFIGIASYRDPLCNVAVLTAFERAKHPERIILGIVEQNSDGDVKCLRTEKPCDKDSTQTICKYIDQIRLKEIDARTATGPTFGRYHADLLYNDEYFALQVDAHMTFINNWDEIAIKQWSALENDMAVLTTYPSEVTKSVNTEGDSIVKTAPIICNTQMGGNGMFKHDAAGEIRFPVGFRDVPLATPFFGAGIAFSRGHRIIRVPYDGRLPMVFDGEEMSMGVRLWTSGYDLYAPNNSFSFHPYGRKKRPPTFWENQGRNPGVREKAHRRIRHIFGQSYTGDVDLTEIEKYGLGKKRKLETYSTIFGVNFQTGKTKNNCPITFSGLMHKRLHSFIRPDKMGIDYSMIPDHILS